MIIFQQPIPY